MFDLIVTPRPQNDSSRNWIESLDQVVWPPNAKRPRSQDNNSIKTLKNLFPLHKMCLWLWKVVKCVASVALWLQSVTCCHIVFWRVNYKARSSSNACNASNKLKVWLKRKKTFSKLTSDNLAKKCLVFNHKPKKWVKTCDHMKQVWFDHNAADRSTINSLDQILMISFPLEKMCLWIWNCLKSCCA